MKIAGMIIIKSILRRQIAKKLGKKIKISTIVNGRMCDVMLSREQRKFQIQFLLVFNDFQIEFEIIYIFLPVIFSLFCRRRNVRNCIYAKFHTIFPFCK